MRPKSPWTHAHVRLKRLYKERIGDSMTQEDFGKRYGIGNQSMVAQYLNGTRPLLA
jgi:transcriptional regulator with XRE-family HTH domain